MAVETLALNTVELSSTLRPAPLNGAPSSDDWNDSFEEQLSDLAALANLWNTTLMPMLNGLPVAAANGIVGSAIISDPTDTTPTFFNSTSGDSLCVADSLRVVVASQNDLSVSLSKLSTQVTQLSSRVSATNQNNVAQALQTFSTQLNSVLAQLRLVQAAQVYVRPQITSGEPTSAQPDGTVMFDPATHLLWVCASGVWYSK